MADERPEIEAKAPRKVAWGGEDEALLQNNSFASEEGRQSHASKSSAWTQRSATSAKTAKSIGSNYTRGKSYMVQDKYRFKIITEHSQWGWKEYALLILFLGLYILYGVMYGLFRRKWTGLETFYVITGAMTSSGAGDYTFARYRNGDETEAFDVITGMIMVVAASFGIVAIVSLCIDYMKFIIDHRDSIQAHDDVVTAIVFNRFRGICDNYDPAIEIRRLWKLFWRSLSALVLYILVIAGTFAWINNTDYLRSIYYMLQMVSTNNFGDVYPESEKAIVFCAGVNLVTIFFVIPSIVFTIMIPFKISELREYKSVFTQFGNQLDVEHFQALCDDPLMNALIPPQHRGEKKITRGAYALWCLMSANMVEPEALAAIFAGFDKIDADRTGQLTIIDTQMDRGSHFSRRQSVGSDPAEVSSPESKNEAADEIANQNTVENTVPEEATV